MICQWLKITFTKDGADFYGILQKIWDYCERADVAMKKYDLHSNVIV